jgi:LPS O-antigen subunit length determinant protein (WzzB/FepE family)
MSRRNKILIIIAVILIIAVLLLLLFLRLLKKPTEITTTTGEPVLPKVQNLTPREAATPPVTTVDATRETLAALARTFTERFGSFSNQSNYVNLADLYPMETVDVQKWTAIYVGKLRKDNPPSGPYYGMTTRALNVAVKILDADNAEAVVGTQREETKGAAAAVITYQDLKLTFKRVNQKWLVDFVKWQ